MFAILPTGLVLFVDFNCGAAEGGDDLLLLLALGDNVHPSLGLSADVRSDLARLAQQNFRIGADPDVPPTSSILHAHDPACLAGLIEDEDQPVAVGIAPGILEVSKLDRG